VEPPLRLTPLGRLVVGLLVVLALCGVATVTTSVGASAAREAGTVTVEAGQTLSGIADEYLPALSVPEGVARLQLFNGLSMSQIHVGQVLRIPDL
jgi:LysM repeat protein